MKKPNQENEIIDICTNILKQDNIIVYPSNGHSGGTCFFVKQIDNGKTIFVAHGPLNGYGITISETDTFIPYLKSTPDLRDKIRKLYDACGKKSYKQTELRAQIAERERLAKLTVTKHRLLMHISKSK